MHLKKHHPCKVKRYNWNQSIKAVVTIHRENCSFQHNTENKIFWKRDQRVREICIFGKQGMAGWNTGSAIVIGQALYIYAPAVAWRWKNR